MNKMKLALVILMTMASLAMLKTTSLKKLGNFVLYDRANIFVGKIMPSQYIKIEKEVEKPCQCRYLCRTMKNCSSATWLGMPNNSISWCLISQEYFSHMNLSDPTTEDYASYFNLTGQTTEALSCVTFHWFRDDYRRNGKYYKVHHVAVKFSMARKTCKSEGGRLVTLETKKKLEEVTGLSEIGEGGIYWIGLHRNDSEQHPMWQYINGATKASSHLINSSGNRNCFSLQSLNEEWIFKDIPCGTNLSFVCERNF